MELGSIQAASSIDFTGGAIQASLLTGAQNLAAIQADILMASLGVGQNVNAYA